MWSAREALKENSFEDVVRTAILFGNDADTTCAVSSGLAGIKLGAGEIPKRWLQQLRGFELVEPLVISFLASNRPKLFSLGSAPPKAVVCSLLASRKRSVLHGSTENPI